jgi:NitT/TauT family transport system ATP-binding protein
MEADGLGCRAGVAVEVRGLWKAFNGRPVLASVDIAACRGEVTAIVGPNGSGKTTLLRIIAGLDRDYRGLVRVEGRPLLVFQETLLLPWKKLRDNVALGLLYRGVSRREAYHRVETVAELLGFREHLDKYPWEVSGGTARKAAIARMLVLDPDILLLDEPLAGLDVEARRRLLEFLEEQAHGRGKTILLVDHSIEHVAGHADRLYVLGGTPSKVVASIDLRGLEPRERIARVYSTLARTLQYERATSCRRQHIALRQPCRGARRELSPGLLGAPGSSRPTVLSASRPYRLGAAMQHTCL